MPESDGNVSDEYELVGSGNEWQGEDTDLEDELQDGPFSCKACGSLLRDNVECASCHSLFCREHLRIDKVTLESPCPCAPCAYTGTEDSFLPNIPVQRMADAVPSRCDACGASLSWGELATHECDLQIVSCEYAQWGCGWRGHRVRRAEHVAASTCPGKLARAEQEAADARAELAVVTAELAAACEAAEIAERRATVAEMRGQELEARISSAEKSLVEKDALILKAKKEATAASSAASSASAYAPGCDRRKKKGFMAEPRGARGGGPPQPPDSSVPPQFPERSRCPANAPATPGTPQEQQQQNGMFAMFNKNKAAVTAAFSTSSTPPAPATIANAAPPTAGTDKVAAPVAPPQQLSSPGRPPASLADSKGSKSKPSHGPAAPSVSAAASLPRPAHTVVAAAVAAAAAAAATATAPTASAQGVAPVGAMEAACQAPAPATEACLKPFLERPRSLLEKKVVVFWPR